MAKRAADHQRRQGGQAKDFFQNARQKSNGRELRGLSADDKDWVERAEVAARAAIRERKKEISEEALAEL